jgi:uncharacterized beta-barrel protein YwiB (DUF1934 family)
MKRKVRVSIRGVQNNVQGESVEVVSMGEMREADGQIFVTYEEAAEEDPGVDCEIVKCMLKATPEQVEIIKEGDTQTHMIFIEDKDTLFYYSTPAGELEVAIHTDRLERTETEDGFEIILEYALEINTAHMWNCDVAIKVEYL